MPFGRRGKLFIKSCQIGEATVFLALLTVSISLCCGVLRCSWLTGDIDIFLKESTSWLRSTRNTEAQTCFLSTQAFTDAAFWPHFLQSISRGGGDVSGSGLADLSPLVTSASSASEVTCECCSSTSVGTDSFNFLLAFLCFFWFFGFLFATGRIFSPRAMRCEISSMAYSASVGEFSNIGGSRSRSAGGSVAIIGTTCQNRKPKMNTASFTMYFVGIQAVKNTKNVRIYAVLIRSDGLHRFN